MEKSLSSSRHETDIADEKYKGPGAIITGLGYTSAIHLFATLGGAVAGILVGLVAHKQVSGLLKSSRTRAAEWAAGSGVKSWAGKFSNWLVGAERGIHAHLIDEINHVDQISPKLKKEMTGFIEEKDWGFLRRFTHGLYETGQRVAAAFRGQKFTPEMLSFQPGSEEKMEVALLTMGAGGVTAWGGASIWGFLKGGHKSNVAKEQLYLTQNEVKLTRTERDMLREKYVQAKLELEDVRTIQSVQDGTLQVFKDDTPDMRRSANTVNLDSGTGTIDDPKIKAPEIKTPEIKEPVIAEAPKTTTHHSQVSQDSGNGIIEAPTRPDAVIKGPPPRVPGRSWAAEHTASESHAHTALADKAASADKVLA